MNFTDEIANLALDLAKSLWAELGVGSAHSRHGWQAIDLEPLIIFTASLRLTAKPFVASTARWCATNAKCISLPRLRSLAPRFSPATRGALSAYQTAIAEAGARGPAESAQAEVSAGELLDLKRPALIQLRLRALFGAGPRAEVLRLMLADPEEKRTAASLAAGACFSKTSVDQALDTLTAAGVTSVQPDGVGSAYRLTRPTDLAAAMYGVPIAFPDWIAVFTVIDAIKAYADMEGADQKGRLAAARAAVSTLQSQLSHLGVTAQVPAIKTDISVTAFEHWALSFVAEHAGATQRADAHEAAYSIHRLAVGGWIVTVTVAGAQPRPLALSDVKFHPERRAKKREKPDPLAAAAAVVHMMLQDMLGRGLERRLGSTVNRTEASEPRLPGLSREFASELLMPMHPGQSATFSEKFLQTWLANRRQAHDLTA